MKRRGFLRGLGFGGVLGAAATVPVQAAAARTEKRDLAWARRRVAEGHRVRLEKWAHDERAEMKGDEGVVTIRQGTRAGIVELDELVVTVEVLEGPWEVVPEEDHPRAPEPRGPEPGGLWIAEPEPNDIWLQAGGNGAPSLTLRGRGD